MTCDRLIVSGHRVEQDPTVTRAIEVRHAARKLNEVNSNYDEKRPETSDDERLACSHGGLIFT
jgi:hypothetical protein